MREVFDRNLNIKEVRKFAWNRRDALGLVSCNGFGDFLGNNVVDFYCYIDLNTTITNNFGTQTSYRLEVGKLFNICFAEVFGKVFFYFANSIRLLESSFSR